MTREEVDITLLLEGTYPFVRGGVSQWLHDLIKALPEFTFRIVFLGPRREDLGPPVYDLPSNIRELQCHFLFDPRPPDPPRGRTASRGYLEASLAVHDWFRNPGSECDPELLQQVLLGLGDPSGCPHSAFFFGREVWEVLCEGLARYYPDAPFNQYFWTVQGIHAPLFALAKILKQVGPSRVFHTISTGYAGYLGALLQLATGRPLLLTEHGIYTKERKIDLEAQHLLAAGEGEEPRDGRAAEVGRDLWTRFFESLGRIAYARSRRITTLYERNRLRQIKDGAAPERTLVIPNGVDLERFAPMRSRRPCGIPPVLGLLGRVVPIKDVKTFIRAMRIVVSRKPEAEGWLIGPTEEDPGYAEECRELVRSLGLEENVRFLGFQRTEEVLPRLGLLVLTSISEAFPLAIIEAFATGLPVISTDVGACRELIEGRTEEDRALGSAGAVLPICDPEATANAALELLGRPEQWHGARRAGIRRVETYYTRQQMVDRYRALYRENMA